MRRGYNIGPTMTTAQYALGWLYLPFYVLLTSLGLQFLARLLDIEMTDFQLNLLYFTVNFVFVLAVYHRFLLKSLRGFTEHFWQFIQTLILGFALYYFIAYVLLWVLNLLAGDVPNFNDEVIGGYISENRTVMLICSVVVAPIVEETLVRGVVFGSFHRKNRIVAYAVSVLLFSAFHVWQYYDRAGLVPMLINALRYIPASVALGWTYEKSGTIWTSIVLHALINAISYGIYVL